MTELKTDECLLVEAIARVHPNVRTIAAELTDEVTTIKDFVGNKDGISWRATCLKCLGDVTVQHSFNDEEFGDYASVTSLPEACPLKPLAEDSPVVFFKQTPR